MENVLQRNIRTGSAGECIFRAFGVTNFSVGTNHGGALVGSIYVPVFPKKLCIRHYGRKLTRIRKILFETNEWMNEWMDEWMNEWMNEIPIFHNTKLHDWDINLQLCRTFLFCKKAAVGLLLTARKPTKSNTFLLQCVVWSWENIRLK